MRKQVANAKIENQKFTFINYNILLKTKKQFAKKEEI